MQLMRWFMMTLFKVIKIWHMLLKNVNVNDMINEMYKGDFVESYSRFYYLFETYPQSKPRIKYYF